VSRADHSPAPAGESAVAVLGLGLIGGSLLRKLTDVGLPAVGYARDPRTRTAAREVGLEVSDDIDGALAGRQIAVVAVPLPAVPTLFDATVGWGGLVTDVTSVKGPVAALARARGLRYVGGHPMAGTEQSGFAASDTALFVGANWVLTLDDDTGLDDWLALARIVLRTGARVVATTSAEHDRAVAANSHLPHVVAAALSTAAGENPLALSLAAGSFRDATRVAATRAELTAAMCGGNADALRERIDDLIARLAAARDVLDDDALTAFFEEGRRVRAAWPPTAGGERSIPIADPDLRSALLAAGRVGAPIIRADADRLTLADAA
jgi:prephenate dehydrogenase